MEPPEELTSNNPSKWKAFVNELRKCIIANKPVGGIATSMSESDKGTAVNAVIPKLVIPQPAPIEFQLKDLSDGTGCVLGIYGGTISDTGGTVHEATGLNLSSYTAFAVHDGDARAWLIITYHETSSPTITSVTVDTGDSTPANESGTLYVEIGTFFTDETAKKVTIFSSPIGSQVFEAWRLWSSNPVQYSAECGRL